MEAFGIDFGSVESLSGLKRSWQECLRPGEQIGGPSLNGNSWWSDFLRCPRRFYLAHIRRLAKNHYEKPLEVGGLFHECVAIFYRALQKGQKEASECSVTVNDLLDRAGKITPTVAMEARSLWIAWFSQYGPDGYMPISSKVLGSEVLLTTERVSNRWKFPYSARLDAVLLSDRGPHISELKTARAMTSDLLTGYEMSGQFLGQAWLWKQLEEHRTGKLQSFFVDLVVKTKSPTLEVVEVRIADKALKEWEKSMQAHYVDLLRCAQSSFWPQNHNNCVSWSRNSIANKQCRFHTFCSTQGKSMDGLRKKKKTEW